MKKHVFLKTLLSSLMVISTMSAAVTPVVAEDAETEAEVTEIVEATEEVEETEEVVAETQDSEEGEETEIDIEIEEEEEEESAIGSGSIEFDADADEVTVTAAAPEGAFPEGTEMTAETVTDPEVLDLIKNAVGEDATILAAVDITFTSEGEAVQPDEAVKVAFAANGIVCSENLKIVHVDDKGEELIATVLDQEPVETEDGGVAFDADSFSVYAVVGVGETARLHVKFVNGEDEIYSTYVKRSDINAKDINGKSLFDQIIFDPGAGTLNTGEVFRGWTKSESYSVADAQSGMNIDEVREDVKTKLGTEYQDGEEVVYHAMIYTVYNIAYKDEDQVVIRNDSRLTLGDPVEYEINEPYVPKTTDQEFQGWYFTAEKAVKNKATGQVYADGSSIDNETTVIIESNLTLSVKAPSGFWLIFKENAKGASFTSPQFLEGVKPTKPSDPIYASHTFGGWYTDAACTEGNEFDFDKLLTETTTVYAKWTPNTTARYNIIIWKQNVNDNKNAADSAKTYDFAESISGTGNVGDVINDVTATGSGDSRYASVNGTAKRYEGFHLNRYDTNVTVDLNGTSVVNVYYDRNKVTLTFRYRSNGSWVTQTTMDGLYGQTLTQNGYTWPTNRWWYDDYSSSWGSYSGAGTRTTFLDAFIISNGASSQTFYGFAGSGNKTVNFYKQNAAGTYPTTPTNTATVEGAFNISDKYNGYKAVQYRADNGTWTDLGNKDSDGYYAKIASSSYTTLDIRYAPVLYNIQYNDGVYVNGDNAPLDTAEYPNRGELLVKTGVPYGSSLATYNKGGADYYEPTYAGFKFEGWYVDDTCTQPFTFTNMPEGLKVYAKWILIEYRVFLNPNVPKTDTSFEMGGQKTSFRVDYGESINKITGIRDDWELVGWYLDAGLKQPFNFDAYVVTDAITKEYDKTRSTETDKYGLPESDENKDLNRDWITRCLDLYAKWRSKLPGANGITVVYEAENGTFPSESGAGETTLVDPFLYKDAAMSVANTATIPNDENQEFLHWVVQKWNGSEFEDTDEAVLPGDTFEVRKAYAYVEDLEGSTEQKPIKRYTVKLRAEYKDLQEEVKTHIYWYANNGSDPEEVKKVEDLSMNQPVDIEEATLFSNLGYVFAGWARYPTGEKPSSMTDDSHLWLVYNPSDDSFTCGSDVVTQVACDEASPYHDLFAVWKNVGVYHVRYSSHPSDVYDYTMPDYSIEGNEERRSLLDHLNTEDYLYGGYYNYADFDNTTVPYTAQSVKDDTAATDLQTNYWGNDTTKPAFTTYPADAMKPEADTTYFVKEVPSHYLTPYLQYYYNNRYGKFLVDMYLVTAIDDTRYKSIGFGRLKADLADVSAAALTVLPDSTTSVYKDIYFKSDIENMKVKAGSSAEDEVAVTKVNDAVGYVTSLNVKDLAHGKDEGVWYPIEKSFSNLTFNYVPYYVTLDGVTVLGKKIRTITTGLGYVDDLAKSDADNSYGLTQIDVK